MGNNTSTPNVNNEGQEQDVALEKILSTTSYPNYFEAKSLSTNLMKKKKRKYSSTSTTSTVSSNNTVIIEPPIEQDTTTEVLNDRKYLKSNSSHHFYLPVDNEEIDRLVVLHFLIKYVFNGNTMAPITQTLRINNNPKVLDIGCGAGTWILEMATEFPNAEFHGIDLRKMFPLNIKPKNTHFQQHDILGEKKLPYKDEEFDFIRIRLMLGFLSESEFLMILSEVHRILKPLGYIEILDCEYQIFRPGYLTDYVLNQQLKDAISKEFKVDFFNCQQVSTLLMTNNLINIQQSQLKIPIGWGQHQFSQIYSENFYAFLTSMHPKIKEQLSNQDFKRILNECQLNQSHMNWFICYGQKPIMYDQDDSNFIQDFLNEYTD